MPEMTTEVEFSVQCDECGKCMDSLVDIGRKTGLPLILVPPCTVCQEEHESKVAEEARDLGYHEGYSDGEKDKDTPTA